MPKFTIEATFRVPHYRHTTYAAATLEEACKLALEDQDWDHQKAGYDSSGAVYLTGAWKGDTAYHGPELDIPADLAREEPPPNFRLLGPGELDPYTLERAREAYEAHDKVGREWVKGSLFDTLNREAAARVAALAEGRRSSVLPGGIPARPAESRVDLRLFNCCTGNGEPDWSQFDRLEIGGCVSDPDEEGQTIGGQSANQAAFFTIYGRFKEPDGTCEAITDVQLAIDALEIAGELSMRSGLSVVVAPTLANR